MNVKQLIFTVATLKTKLNKPVWWGAAYIFSIPLFALLYWLSSDQFSHSQISKEIETINTVKLASELLDKEISKQFSGSLKIHNLGKIATLDKGISELEQVSAKLATDSIILSGRKWISNVDTITNKSLLPLLAEPLYFQIQLAFEDPTSSRPTNAKFVRRGFKIVDFSAISPAFVNLDPSDALLSVKVWQNKKTKIDRIDRIYVPNDIRIVMNQLYLAQEGQDYLSQGGYFRMLYVSAVTITTLGYGDIVPTSPWTRFLVAAEAVLGIVIMGFFLNSTVARRGQ